MDSLLSEIIESIDSTLHQIKEPIAIFDADGTLWKEDVGFSFFQFQIQKIWNNNTHLLDEAETIYAHNPQDSCAFIVQLCKGINIDDYRKMCRDYLDFHQLTIFSFQRALIQHLKKKQVKVLVVTASSEWLVEEALRYHNLPADLVIGVKTQVHNNQITDQIITPVSFGDGKTKAYLNRGFSIAPFFVSGNTLSDLNLLKISSHFCLTVASAKKDKKQYNSERSLLEIAKKQSWFYKDISS